MLATGGVLVLAGTGAAIAAATTGHGHAATSAARSPGTFVSSSLDRATGFGRHAGTDRHGPGDDLAAAASYLGISASDLLTQLQAGKTLAQVANATSGKSAAGLIAALVAHEKQELADAVSAGKLTQAQADAISANLQQRITDLVNGVRPAFAGPGFGHLGGPGPLGTAASYLGISASDLFTQLRSGKTLAQVANATSGKSAAGLIAALVAHETQELADAVSAGKLTQAQADAISANLEQRITDLVNGVLHVHRPHGFHGPHGDWTGGPRI